MKIELTKEEVYEIGQLLAHDLFVKECNAEKRQMAIDENFRSKRWRLIKKFDVVEKNHEGADE